MFLKKILPICFGFFSVISYGQQFMSYDTILLNEVIIHSSRLEAYSVGSFIEAPDSIITSFFASSSLSDLLSVSTGISPRTYGPGGLSSISMRGVGNAHTAILWNGINIQSPMNSGLNLSALPVSLIGDIQIQYGGSSTLFGSGAMSGVIHLSGKNLLKSENGILLQLESGSYGNKSILSKLKYGNSKTTGSLSVYGMSSDNDFKFINTSRPDRPHQRQTNSGYWQAGLLKENHFQLTDNSVITTGLWVQHYDKNIQTMMTNSRPNEQSQIDKYLIGTFNYKYYNYAFQLDYKQGVFINQVDYFDPQTPGNDGFNRSLSLISELESKFNFNKGQVLGIGMNYTLEKAESNNYFKSNHRHRFALFSFYQFYNFNNKLSSVISARNEISQSTFHPLVYSYGGELSLSSSLKLTGNISRNYRIPTFNDIFWKEDGWTKGNPNLKPESGWSGDTGIKSLIRLQSFSANFSANLFMTQINNWIVWLQGTDNLWMPTNKNKGKSNGIELRLKTELIAAGNSTIGYDIKYSYTKSRLKTNDQYNGKQMIYTPKHRATAIINCTYKKFNSGIAVNSVGRRYYDHQNTLDSYLLGDLFLNYATNNEKLLKSKLSLRINNLWNTSYQGMAWYAMPLRNYSISLNINL